MPGLFGTFAFDCLTGITVSDGNDKMIWGISPDKPYNFDNALKCIHPDYRQLFTDKSLGSVGKVVHVEFKILLLNGNWTLEKYNIVGGKEDYKITNTPCGIYGTSTFLKEAV